MRIRLALLLACTYAQLTNAQETDWVELNIRLSPSVSSAQIAQLASVTEPIEYSTRPGDSLADISSKRYGIKVLMREALKKLNPDLVLEMQKKGKDFFWQPLPAGTLVHLPALSLLIKNVSLKVPDTNDAAIQRNILNRAKAFYAQVGPITVGAIKKVNPIFFAPDPDAASKKGQTKKSARTRLAVLPSVPTFHSLKIRKTKENQALNVLASLTRSLAGSGSIGQPSFLETQDLLSPCSQSEDSRDNWFAEAVHADQVKLSNLTLNRITIAILDSGIDYEHDALKSGLWDGTIAEDGNLTHKLNQTVGIDFTGDSPSNDVVDLSPISHGTHVSGIASGAAIGKALIAFQASQIETKIKIMALKVVDSDQHVNIKAVEDAIQFAQRFQAKLISASWTVAKDTNLQSLMLNNQGTLFVLAAGNGVKDGDDFKGLDLEDPENARYPASFGLDNAITVGALSADRQPALFSNFGTKSVQVFAPGCKITSTVKGNSFARETGTSQAAPFVSLTAALIWAQNPDLPPIAVKKRILQTADPYKASLSKSSAGNLNLAKAISITEDLYEATDNIYSSGEVVDTKITIAADGDSCAETEPLDIRTQKLTRIYRNYADSGKDLVVPQTGAPIRGTICASEIHFKRRDSNAVESVPIANIRDIVFKIK